jgi:hypothetical protein
MMFSAVCSDGEGGKEYYSCTSDEHCYDKVKGQKGSLFDHNDFNGKIYKNDMPSDGCERSAPATTPP